MPIAKDGNVMKMMGTGDKAADSSDQTWFEHTAHPHSEAEKVNVQSYCVSS